MSQKKNNIRALLHLLMFMASVCCSTRISAGIIHQQDFAASDFDIWNMTAPNGESFSKVSGIGMFASGEIGQPELPYKEVRFLVPDNAYDFEVTIESMETAAPLVLDNTILPVQKPISTDMFGEDTGFTFPDMRIYGSLKTTFRAEILNECRIEGRYHIVSVGLWPLAYSGNDRELEMCGSMRINLEFKEKTLLKQKRSSSNGTGFIDISDIVVNADSELSNKALISGLEPGGSIILESSPYYYYIISERSLLPALEDLATWKTQKGCRVITKAIEDIYEDPTYKVGTNGIVDEAASLRKYLQDEYALHGTFFCLLVGDHRTQMPIRKTYWDNIDAENDGVNGDNYIPTDNYFSDLSEDGWPVHYDSAGIYVVDTSVSFNPNIYVGRLLCNKPQEIYNYTKKLILYETNPGRGNSDYLDKTTLTVMYDGSGSYSDVKSEMESLFIDVECLLDCRISNIKSKGYPSGKLMLDKLNESGYCSWIGHGEPSSVACSGLRGGSSEWEYVKALTSYNYKDDPTTSPTGVKHICDDNGLDKLTNYDSPSIVNTLACTTCPFDIYRSEWANYDLPQTMASSYTVGGLYGGVAYLGNTRPGYFSHSSELEVLFLQQLTKNHKLGITEAISKSLYNVYKSSNSSYTINRRRHVRHAHNLIGDPEFEMWTSSPSILNAEVSWNATDISIGGTDAKGCRVVVNDGEGNIRIRNFTFVVNSPVTYADGGKMEAVGIFKTGFLPIVKLNCFNDELEDCTKKFAVRDAILGADESSSVKIGQNADIDIRAVDNISVGKGVTVLSDGGLRLRCDKEIDLEGAKVSKGGTLMVSGEKVTLSKGFSVKIGASLSINSN